MIEKHHIIRIGSIFVLGLLIQVTSSSLFEWVQGIMKYSDKAGYDLTYRDYIVMLGQDLGELCYAFAFFLLFKKAGVWIFRAFVDFFIALLLIDMFHITFTNPYVMPLSKFVGFGGSFLWMIFRIVTYLKQHERTIN